MYVAFSADSGGGNPAGVVLDAVGLDDAVMQAKATELGFSETAFVVARQESRLSVRYFSPGGEVPFCGHATIATAVAYAEREGIGDRVFLTRAGSVPVSTAVTGDGTIVATLVSVPPRLEAVTTDDVDELLAALRWSRSDLEIELPPRVAYAGAWHPIIAAVSRSRLAELDYDMAALGDLMRRKDWATVNLVWRESPTVYHARNPFPPGGVVEDPATGAAAAALGGYLRELGVIQVPTGMTVYQGYDMGRPSTITVSIPADPGSGIAVTGTAVRV